MFQRYLNRKQLAFFSIVIVFLVTGCLWAQAGTELTDSTSSAGTLSVEVGENTTPPHQLKSSFHLPNSTSHTDGKVQSVGFHSALADSGSNHLPDASSIFRLLLVGVGLFALRRPSRKSLQH